jgi:hypothetical protein
MTRVSLISIGLAVAGGSWGCAHGAYMVNRAR